MRIAPSLACLALIGCSEYDLDGELNKNPTATTSTTIPTEQTEIELCSTAPVPGFDAQLNESCATRLETGVFSPIIEWDMPTFPGPPGDNVMSTPIVVSITDDDGDGDIDVDDTPDIVFVAFDGLTLTSVLRAIDGATGTQHFAIPDTGIQFTGGVAAGDLDGDGLVELVSLTPQGAIVFDHTGAILWEISTLWSHISGTSDVPAISDMDHDGHPEIIAGRAIINSEDGSIQGIGAYGYGGVFGWNVGSCSFAVDLDADGTEEVITGNAAYNPDGSVKWYNSALVDGYPAVADIDGDGQGEVIVSGQGEIRILDTDGTLLSRTSIPGASLPGYGGPPTMADFDGDGHVEIGVASGSRYSVLETDGTIVWQSETDDSSSGNTGSAVFDFEGDGSAEVVYADQTRLWVFSGVDGSVRLESNQHSNGTWLEYAVIADVDGDNHVEIVVPNEWQWGGESGITVFGDAANSWQAGRKIWNQHAYHITNVGDDGSIPQFADLNWLTYNNFRSGDLSVEGGLLAPDLLPASELCEIECDDGRLIVHVLAGNQGMADVAASEHPTVELWSKREGDYEDIGIQVIEEDLRAGTFEDSLVFEIESEEIAEWDAILIRLSSSAIECEPGNNEIEIPGPFCQ